MMKRHLIIYTAAAVLISVQSCNELDRINTNPNNMTVGDIHPSSLLPNILFSGAESLDKLTYNLGSELIQHTVGTSTTQAFHRFQIPNGVSSGLWNNCARWAASADHMRELAAADPGFCNFEAIALTMRAFYMQTLTDSYGDAPFSEAFRGMDGEMHPKFDTQKEIYLQLIEDLKRANSLYNATGRPMTESQSNKDLLYGGNLDRWKRFTNSLLLRVIMRASYCEDIDAAGLLTEIYSNPGEYPVFSSEADAAVYRFTGIDNNLNPYGSTTLIAYQTPKRAAEFLVNLLDRTGDPRISLFFNQVGGKWEGAVSGIANRDEGNMGDAAKVNKDILGDYDSPYSFMNYDEVLFIWAEAAKRGLIAGGEDLAASYYRQAVEASVRHWSDMPGNDNPVSDLAISQFLVKVAYDGTYEQIMTQKYVALFWVGFEAWAEYRRTEFPSLTIAQSTMNDHILPRRFEYPVNTASTNKDNYAEALARLRQDYKGDDDMKTPVWWSKNRIENFR